MSKLDEMFTCTKLGQGFKPIEKSKKINNNRIPEAGDLFKDEYGEKAHILWVGYVVVYVRKYWITSYEYHYEVGKLDYDKFIRKWTYLGKSKATIEQLFELENNGKCVEDNTPHVESTVLFKDLENKE